MEYKFPRLKDIKSDIPTLIRNLNQNLNVMKLLVHDSMKVYYNVSIEQDKYFSISELPTTTARAELILPILKELITQYGEEASVLDLACSPGYFMFKIAGLGVKKIVGVDAREDHCKQFKILNSYYKFNEIEFVQSDIYEFLDRSFIQNKKYDICLLFGFLYHTITPVELLRSIKKICNKCLIIDTTLTRSEDASLTIFDEPTSWSRASTTKISAMPSLKAVLKLLEASGFKDIEMIEPDIHYESYNPGGNNIDYFFKRTESKKQLIPSVLKPIIKNSRFARKLINEAMVSRGSRRAYFKAFI